MKRNRIVQARAAHIILAVAISLALTIIGDLLWGCGPFLTFRAYLKRSFWEPVYYHAGTLVPASKPAQSSPFAGFLPSNAPPALAAIRAAYGTVCGSAPSGRDLSSALESAHQALAAGTLSGNDMEEALLLDCKIDMRLGEGSPRLLEVQRKLERFIAGARNPAFASEARGWLARVLYLQEDYAGAAKIYLDEMDSPASNLGRDTLVTSLRMTVRDGEGQLWQRLEEFFDKPRHALFILNLITNGSRYWDNEPQPQKAVNGRKALQLLQRHQSLFASGPDSEALTMASMRAALYIGDPELALRSSRRTSRLGSLLSNPEFNWMVAVSHFVRREYSAAEKPLLRMLQAHSATPADRRTAAHALIGVYFKAGRKIDALHAALMQASQPAGSEMDQSPRLHWCDWCFSLDLPYLLDAQLGPDDLREYLKKYPKSSGAPIPVFGYGRDRVFSSTRVVQYSLAVHLARREEYAESAQIYQALGIAQRAARMEKAAAMLARTRDSATSRDDRLRASYEYGRYLADNPERLFFNDLFWRGFQSDAFVGVRGDWSLGSQSQSGLTARERKEVMLQDRLLRDRQEERWQAYRVLERVAGEAGHSELGRSAARKLLDSLVRINTARFGREKEIGAAVAKWKKWLRQAWTVQTARMHPWMRRVEPMVCLAFT